MKEILKSFFKIILTLFILILFIVLFQTSFNFLQRQFIGNNTYYMITSEYTFIYGVFASLIITFLIFLLLFKKESEKYIPYIFNKKVLPIIIIILVFGYIYSLFKIDVVYDNSIKAYSLFQLKGEGYVFEDIKEVNIEIKKNMNQTYNLYYVIEFEEREFEIFKHATDFGLELEKFDHITILNSQLEKLNIEIEKEDKYLENYLDTLEEKEKNKVKSLFD